MPSWHAQVRGQADDTVDGICVSGFILHYLVHRCKLRPLFGPVNNTASIIKIHHNQNHYYHISLINLTCKGPSAVETCFVVSPCLYGHLITHIRRSHSSLHSASHLQTLLGSVRITHSFFTRWWRHQVPGNLTRELLPSKNRCLCCVSSISW